PRPLAYALSLHDALPIFRRGAVGRPPGVSDAGGALGEAAFPPLGGLGQALRQRLVQVADLASPFLGQEDPAVGDRHAGRVVAAVDRKITRLNSSHVKISY